MSLSPNADCGSISPGGSVPNSIARPNLKPSVTSFNRENEPQEDGPACEFREGLPKTYRPRHDLHYVEQLTAATDTQPVRLVPVSRIDSADLPEAHTVAGLADSIVDLGIVQPLLVRPHNGRFRLIAGKRRLAAARRAGLPKSRVWSTRSTRRARRSSLRPTTCAARRVRHPCHCRRHHRTCRRASMHTPRQ